MKGKFKILQSSVVILHKTPSDQFSASVHNQNNLCSTYFKDFNFFISSIKMSRSPASALIQ